MSTLQKKRPNNINLIDEVDTILIDQKTLDNGIIPSSGIYKINDEIVDDKRVVRLIQENKDDNQSTDFTIMNGEGAVLLGGTYVKWNCFQKSLELYSPTGFLLGSVKGTGYFQCSADYKICSASQNVLYLIKLDYSAQECVINITRNTNENVAIASARIEDDGKVVSTVTYLKNIPVLQKFLILCAVVACQQEISSKRANLNLYCALYYERKVKFFLLCILFPIVLVVYLTFILAFTAYFIATLFSLLLSRCCSKDSDFSCVFTWPCRLCQNRHSFKQYILCCNRFWCIGHILIFLFIVIFVHGFGLYHVYMHV